MPTIASYKQSKSSNLKQALKGKTGKAQDVAVVNTPTVKIDHSVDSKPTPPILRLTSDDLDAIKGWKVGGKYKLQLEVEQTGARQGSDSYDEIGDSGSNSKKVSATFRVTSVKAG